MKEIFIRSLSAKEAGPSFPEKSVVNKNILCFSSLERKHFPTSTETARRESFHLALQIHFLNESVMLSPSKGKFCAIRRGSKRRHKSK